MGVHCCSCVAMLADLYYAESACGAATVGSSEVSSSRTRNLQESILVEMAYFSVCIIRCT